jgi:putative transposase
VSRGVFVPTITSKKVYRSTLKAQVVQEILREEKPLAQIASEHGIYAKVLREWKAIALRHLTPAYPNHAWAIDITSIWLTRSWLYLTECG